MKISGILSLFAVISPAVSAANGLRKLTPGDQVDGALDTAGDVAGDFVDTTVDTANTAGNFLNGLNLGCFSGTTTVQVLNKGSIAMKDLQVGDQVMTSKSYQSVYAFAHKADFEFGEFVQFNGQLEMTPEHMVFLQGKNTPVRADAVKVGDVLRGESSTPVEVTHIGSVTKQGLYAPLTKDGSVVVDGVVASSYISLQEGTNMMQVNGVDLPMCQQSFVHLSLSPFRMMCSLIECNSYDEQGIAPYATTLINFVEWAAAQNWLVQFVVLAFALVVLAASMVLETGVGAPLAVAGVYGIMMAKGASKVKSV